MEHKRPPGQVSAGGIARFVVNTRRGRVLASVYLAAAALFGLLLGVFSASDTVSSVAVIVFAGIATPVVLLRAIKAIRPRHGHQ